MRQFRGLYGARGISPLRRGAGDSLWWGAVGTSDEAIANTLYVALLASLLVAFAGGDSVPSALCFALFGAIGIVIRDKARKNGEVDMSQSFVKTFPSTTVMRKITVVTLTETRRNSQFTYIFQAIRSSWTNTVELKSFPLKTVMGNWFPITHCYVSSVNQ